MMSSSGFQRVNGLRLYVHRFREESVAPTGLTIVLVHGFMDSGATWDMVAPTLARAGHDVVAPDLRGFGQSDFVGAGGYYHFPDYVADLAELVDSLAPRRLALVGHSMGGTVAGLYAGTFPERVERLALLEGMGPVSTEPALAVDRMQAWLRSMHEVVRQQKPLTSLQEAVERLALHHPRVAREVIESRARLLTRVDDAGRLVWAYDPLHRTTAPTPFNVDSFKAFLRRIECPTLVVSGGPAGWHPPDEADRVACLKHPATFELPHAGHMMHWTEPMPLAQRLFHFFGEAPPARKPMPSYSGVRGDVAAAAAGAAGQDRVSVTNVGVTNVGVTNVGVELPLSATNLPVVPGSAGPASGSYGPGSTAPGSGGAAPGGTLVGGTTVPGGPSSQGHGHGHGAPSSPGSAGPTRPGVGVRGGGSGG